jgi:hypothetical protein
MALTSFYIFSVQQAIYLIRKSLTRFHKTLSLTRKLITFPGVLRPQISMIALSYNKKGMRKKKRKMDRLIQLYIASFLTHA